jgi:NAD(P)-dependent dehydrogenase (short-subunit alcohol dehydrogenase family)
MPVKERRVVMITGSAGNLGLAVARAFLDAHASLVLIDRAPDRLAHLFPELVNSEDHFLAQSVDLTDANAVAETVDEALRRFDRIDVLINAAGGYRAGPSVDATPLEDWDFIFNLNARSIFTTSRAVIPAMRRQRRGKIINVASRSALRGEANAALYSASKSVVVRLTESMAAELRDAGVNVNCVLPGIIDTPINRKAMPNGDFSRWVQPEALAEVIAFLASDAAREVTGAAVPVYGRS